MVSFIDAYVAPSVAITALTSSRPWLRESSQDCFIEGACQKEIQSSTSGEKRWHPWVDDFPGALMICGLIHCFLSLVSISMSGPRWGHAMGDLSVISDPGDQLWHLLFAWVLICPDKCFLAPFSYSPGGFWARVQNIQEKCLHLLPLNSPREPSWCTRSWGHTLPFACRPQNWKRASDGKDLARIQGQASWGTSGISGGPILPGKSSFTLPLFTALCHWDVREQNLFHRKQPGNSQVSKVWIPFLHLSPSIFQTGFHLSLTIK